MPTSPGTHPSDDALELYSMGRMSETESAPLEQHLLTCGDCRDRLEDSDEYVASMHQALQELVEDSKPASSSPARNWFPRFLSVPAPVWAGSAVAVALILFALPIFQSLGGSYATRLEAWRGETGLTSPVVPAGQPLALTVDVSGLPVLGSYAIRIVDSRGVEVAAATAGAGGDDVVVDLDSGLSAEQYWVRIYEPATGTEARGELLREFGLRAE
jgi:hypothetical protein